MWWIITGLVIVGAATAYFVFGRSVADGPSSGAVDRHGSALSDIHARQPAEPGSEDQAVVGDGVTGPSPGVEPLDS